MIDEDKDTKSIYDGDERAPTDMPWPMANRAALFEARVWPQLDDTSTVSSESTKQRDYGKLHF